MALENGYAHGVGLYPSCSFLMFLSTVHYISPEVAKGDEYIGMQSDIWSAGVILFTMVTASIPFQGESKKPVA